MEVIETHITLEIDFYTNCIVFDVESDVNWIAPKKCSGHDEVELLTNLAVWWTLLKVAGYWINYIVNEEIRLQENCVIYNLCPNFDK